MAKKGHIAAITPSPKLLVPKGQHKDLKPSELLLDPANLRLLEVADESLANTSAKLIGQPAVQRRVLDVILESTEADIAGLRNSIISNTFLRHERLIVAPYDEDQYIVLEGNRRLSAVKSILLEKNKDIPPQVIDSIGTLPCIVLEGDPKGPISKKLDYFRKQAEVFIGMRHLMGAKEWEPASRYEFQHRLIEEGWSVGDVAKRFNRKNAEVLRDLLAHKLFRDFRDYEHKLRYSHQLTYNAFSEAARSRSIKNWLGWSTDTQEIENPDNEKIFFKYLVSELSRPLTVTDEEDEAPQKKSAEFAVRHLSQMLSLDDEDINDAISDRDFINANLIFETRKEGKLPRRIQNYIRSLNNVSTGELSGNLSELKDLLNNLIETTGDLLDLVNSRINKRTKK